MLPVLTQRAPMRLTLRDGWSQYGYSFGAQKEVVGEVVFNTAMTGYVETLTDPSYQGQILVLTYPLQGNYGVPSGPFESTQIQVAGLIVNHYSENPHHHASIRTLGEWLKSEGIPAIEGIDTRQLTRHLRQKGTVMGDIHEDKYHQYGNGRYRILLIDTGTKSNIVRHLLNRDATVICAPWHYPWEQFLPQVQGVFLSNGPGDPSLAKDLVNRVRNLLQSTLPIFGICFGHQVLSLAAGAQTFKMRYGNRSLNQPVQDMLTGKCYITSQNHGYVVDTQSLPDGFMPWFVNLNDHSNEGMRHVTLPIASVQFHPEAAPGPQDTEFLFDVFMNTVAEQCI